MSRFGTYRSILQAGGVYAAGGWLAYEIIDEVGLRAGMPEWVSAAALLLLLLGLPVVLLTAWAQQRAAQQPAQLASDGRDLDPTLHPEFAAAVVPDGGRLAHLLTWRRTLLTGVGMFVLLGFGTTGFMTARTLGYGPFGTLFAQGVLEANDPVLMADFLSERDPALGRAVAEALRIDLVQSSVIRVADAKLVADALERMQRDPADGLPADIAQLLAQREGIKAYIRGEVSTLGSGYQLMSELVAADGAVIQAFRETARDSTQLIDAVDRMSNRLRARIGESLRTIRGSEPLSRVTTASVPALRRYSEGQELSRQTGDMLRVVELYEQAVALDSTFGMAWLGVGITLGNLGIRTDDMLAAFRRAWALRDRMPERERLRAEASYQSHVANDRRATVDAYRSLLVLEPGNSAARNNLALALRQLRRDAEAEALLLPVPPEQRTGQEWLNLAHAQYAQGRIDEAGTTIQQASQHLSTHLNTVALQVQLAVASGEPERADSIVAAAQAAFGSNISAQFVGARYRAALAALQGRVADAVAFMAAAGTVAGRYGLTEATLQVELQTAYGIAFIAGDGPRALRMLDAALARLDRQTLPPQARGYLQVATLYAFAGSPRQARAELEEYERAVPEADRLGARNDLDAARAAIALAEDDAATALPLLQNLAGADGCRICGLGELGRAWEMLGQPDSALVAYQSYIDTPYLGRFDLDPGWRPVVLFRLGELYEQRGDHGRAVQYYAEFVELWRRADAELQPRVDAARRRIAELRAAG